MPEYLHPGVYIEEIERGPRPIEGVPTSTSGVPRRNGARHADADARHVSYKDYQRWFGGVFDERAATCRTRRPGSSRTAASACMCRASPGRAATPASKDIGGGFIATAVGPGAWGLRVWIRVRDGLDARPGQQHRASGCSSPYWTTQPDGGLRSVR